jgi:hypothetical protein
MGIASRFSTNPNVTQSQEFIPGATIPAAALSTANSTQQQGPSTPQSLYVPQSKLPTRSITTPNGNVTVRYSIIQGAGGKAASLRPEAITKNAIFTQPYTVKSNGFSNTGTTTYDYTLSKNELVPQVTVQTGNITYNNTVVGTVNNGKITPTKNAINQNITNAGINLGTIQYQPVVNNNTLQLQYANFKGTVVEKTVPEYYSDPFSGMTYKVGFTYGSNPTTYNAKTNQVNLTFPSMSSTFGSSPLFINSQSTNVSVNGTPQKVFYNINTSPSSQTTYFTGFDIAGASSKSINIGQSGGSTTKYSIINGSIQGVNANAPISMANIASKASLTYNSNGQYSVVNNGASTEYLTGGINVKGIFSLQTNAGQQTEVFNPLAYSFANGSTTNTIITTAPADTILAKDLLNAQGLSTSSITSIFSAQPQSITETINSKTGQLSILGTPYTAAQSFNFNSTGHITGYINFNANGAAIGGADFLNPKNVVLTTNPKTSGLITKGTVTLLSNQLPSNYGKQSYAVQHAQQVQTQQNKNSQNFLNIETSVFSLVNHQPSSITQLQLKYYNPALQAYNGGQVYSTGQTLKGLEMLGGSVIQGEAPVFIVASPLAAGIGALANVGVSEALSYATTSKPLGVSGTVNAAFTGATSGGILGAFTPAGSSISGFVVKQTFNIVKYNAIFGGTVSAAYGLINPSVYSSTQAAPSTTEEKISFRNKNLIQLNSSQQSQPKVQQTNWASNIYNTLTNPSYLSFVGKGTLQGAQFGTSYAGEFAIGSVILKGAISILPESTTNIIEKPYLGKAIQSVGLGASMFGYGIITGQPLRLALVEGAAGAALPIIGSIGADTPGKIEITPKSTALGYSNTPSGMSVAIGSYRNPTSLDLLNKMNAQSTYFMQLPTEEGIITVSSEEGIARNIVSTPNYQASFSGGRILYAINPNPEVAGEALSGASLDIGSKLYGSQRAFFGATIADRMPQVITEKAQGSVVQSVGYTQADVRVIKSGKVFGVNTKSILDAKIINIGNVEAGTTDTQTQFGEGETRQKVILNVKLSGMSTREVVISDKLITTPTAVVTAGGKENFIGRIVSSTNGLLNTESENTGSFYGEKSTLTPEAIKKDFGVSLGKADYSGKTILVNGDKVTVVPTIYYDSLDFQNMASKMGIDLGQGEAKDVVQAPKPKPLKPYTVSTTADLTANIGKESGADTVSSGDQKTITVEKTSLKAPPPNPISRLVYSSYPLKIGMENPYINVVPGYYDAYISKNSRSIRNTTGLSHSVISGHDVINGYIPKLGIGGVMTNRTNTSNKLNQKPILPFTTKNPFAIKNPTTERQNTSNKSIMQRTSLLKQKSTTKEIQKTQPTPPPALVNPEPEPDYNFKYNPFKLKIISQPHKQRATTPSTHRFGYVSDLTHALLNIRGSATKIGLSRPIPIKRGKKR